jgi:4-amino-4-deoxy-L-arabinose transferase-like glycosyltransferase
LLVYLVVRELTKNQFAAAFGFLILLFSNSFYFFAKEMRLDSAMTAAILAALFFYIKGWKNEKYFFWILPCIALGFMLKSVIALLAVPIILIYSVCYWQWTYLRSKYFWWGLGLALLIVVPWHLYETVLFGSSFWNDYIGRQVVQRATSTLTGTNGIGDYAILFIPWYLPWNLVLISALITVTAINSKRDAKEAVVLKPIVAPLVAAFGIFALFTLSRTHLGPYITPAFPFFGIAIGILFDSLCKALPGYKKLMAFIAIVAIIAGAVFCYLFRYADIPPYTYDEAMVGQTYKSQDPNGAPLYIMDYRFTESFDYYGGGQVARPTDPLVIKNQLVKGPFYMAISPAGAMYFFTPPSTPRYPGLKILYVGKYFVLISSDFDLQMPDFKVN